MPGFEPDRFVNNSGDDLEEFKCGICHGIFIKPVVTDCCQQTYCRDCINQWLNHNNTCPNDRKPLTTQQLRPMARAFVNLLDNLKITCDYKSEGCLSSVKICELENHIKECEYRPNTVCKVCQTIRESVSTHNCIDNLLIKINKIEAQNEMVTGNLEENYNILRTSLERQQNNLEKGIDALNEEFQNDIDQIKEIHSMQINEISSKFKKRLNQLKLENVTNVAILRSELEKRDHIFNELKPRYSSEIIDEARQNINNVSLVKCKGISNRKEDFFIEIIKNALSKTDNNSYEAISKFILKNLRTEGFGLVRRVWEVYVYGNQNNRPTELMNKSDFVLIIQFSRLEVTILCDVN